MNPRSPERIAARVQFFERNLPGIAYGGDYNPEQWPRETWDDDIARMKEAGVNFVSVGIFSWVKLEPSEGEFDFTWLDELLDLLHSNGIKVDLATPTVAPPAWFYQKYPQAKGINRAGQVVHQGSRGNADPASPEYREACLRITRALAERYKDHPAIVLWHVHNEYGGTLLESFTEASQAAFRQWLLERYGSLEGINEAWGTAFWGQTYTDIDQIIPPMVTAQTVPSPSLELDWMRYCSDALLECYKAERDVLHELAPNIPVTTNFMGHTCRDIDLFKWGKEVDIVSNDHYLVAADKRNFVDLAWDADLVRGVAGGRPWILMEHSTSGVNWQDRNVAKQPGELARNSLSHFGRGADGIAFFQWRASRKGAEKYHSAMLPHGGKETRIFKEVVQLGRRLQALKAVKGSTVQTSVAILWDYESWWAQELPWRPSIDLTFRQQMRTWYERLWNDHLMVDFVHPEGDLSKYKLIVAPSSYLLTDAACANLREFVAAGGHLVMGPFGGVVDANDGVRLGGLNAGLADVFGVEVHEFCPLRIEDTASLIFSGDGVDLVDGAYVGQKKVQLSNAACASAELTAHTWTEELVVTSAEVVARYTSLPRPHYPAITRNSFGAGESWYISADLDIQDLKAVFADVYRRSGIELPKIPTDVEFLQRIGADGTRYMLFINHNSGEKTLNIPGTKQTLSIAGGDVATASVPVDELK